MAEGRESFREMTAFPGASQPASHENRQSPGVSTVVSDTTAIMIPWPGRRFMENKDYLAATEPCMCRNFTSTDKQEGGTSPVSCLLLFLP